MGYTVTRNDAGTKDAEFEEYARLLRQQGVDLGKLPRAPDPQTGQRWVYVWDSRDTAQAFADELTRRTRDKAWIVQEVAAPASEGPMGPVIVQVGRRSTGLVFGLHPLSRAMIKSAFPTATASATTVAINFDTLQDFRRTHGDVHRLARQVVPMLTGLGLPELERLGYALIDDETQATVDFVRPAELDGVRNGTCAAPAG